MARKTARSRGAREKESEASLGADVPDVGAARALGSGGLLAAALFSFAVVVTFGILWQEFSGRPVPAPKTAASVPAPAAPTPAATLPDMTASGAGEGQAPSLDRAMNNLVARLEADPNDIDGWMLLGRSYMVVGNFAQAEGAYGRAAGLAPGDPDILVALGEALLRNAGDLMTPAADTPPRLHDSRTAEFLQHFGEVCRGDFRDLGDLPGCPGVGRVLSEVCDRPQRIFHSLGEHSSEIFQIGY